MKKEKTQPQIQKQEVQAPVQNLKNPFILKGKELLVKINGQPIEKPVQKNFKSLPELEEVVYGNGSTLFGEKTIFVALKGSVKDPAIPAFLIDLKNPGKPMFYIVCTFFSKHGFAHIILYITELFSIFMGIKQRKQFADIIIGYIERMKLLRKEFKGEEEKITEALRESIMRRLHILLVADSNKGEVKSFVDTYPDTWGETTKPILLRKFSNKGETIITMHPDFDVIRGGKAKSNSEKEKINYTEEYHFEDVSEEIKEVYGKIKSELLKKDSTLRFNPQKYYISVKKNRNICFFHVGRKKISLVVMNPDKATRKVIKHHEVKNLAESVQRFWNGKCCTIIIENMKHVAEVISLLKKLVAGS